MVKSPTCATPRAPSTRVLLSTTEGGWDWVLAGLAGALMREARKVTAYLSERKSHCMPLKVGFEKVNGVRMERIASLIVSEV